MGTFTIVNAPIDKVIPPTPHGQNLSEPPAKTTFALEYFTAAMHAALGFELWSQKDLYEGNYFQPVCARLGQENVANSRGSLELGIHSDNATFPPDFFTLSCERPALNGGKTTYINSVDAIKTLPQETVDVLTQRLFHFDRISGGIYENEEELFLLPIVERGIDNAITTVRIQSRKNSIVPTTEEAKAAYCDFRSAIAAADKHVIDWQRGMVVGSNNKTWCHSRTGFEEPAGDPNGRWLLKLYGDRNIAEM